MKKLKKSSKTIFPILIFRTFEEFVHPKSPRAPRPPTEPWPSTEPWREPSRTDDIRTQEKERAKARAPIEKIKMLKELLDEGMITQEDYDEKKKKILEDI